MTGHHIQGSGAAIAAAWREAAADLGVEFTEGGTLEGSDGRSYPYLGVVHEFGPGGGMLLFADDRNLWYEQYDRALFVDTLDDWGWSGEGEPPDWYTGRPGGEEYGPREPSAPCRP